MLIRSNLFAMIISMVMLTAATTTDDAFGQGFFDGIRRSVQGELQRSAQDKIRGLPPGRLPNLSQFPNVPVPPRWNSPQNPTGQPPTQRSTQLPNESGQENNPGGRFIDNGFLPPGNQIRPVQPTPPTFRPNPVYEQPINGQPINRQPIYGQPTTQPIDQQPSAQTPRSNEPTYGTPIQTPPRRVVVSDVSMQPLKIRNPRSMSQSIPYRLESGSSKISFTIDPGYSQSIQETRVWSIVYQSGGRDVRYRLRGGKTYEFALDESGGVQLYEDTPTVLSEPPKKP